MSRTTGIAPQYHQKYLIQFIELRLTIERVEATSDKQLATAFLMEKPKIESDRTLELELMLPDLVTRFKKRGVTKGMIYRHYISQSTDGLNTLHSWYD